MRPPIGTRWGDLSAEEREALPVGTVMGAPSGWPDDAERIRQDDGMWWVPGGSFGKPGRGLDPTRPILSYPSEVADGG